MSGASAVDISDMGDFVVQGKGRQDPISRAAAHGVREVHLFHDPDTHLKAVIAIHSSRMGRAVGGCRCQVYSSFDLAVEDALRLAKGMSYKAALAGLPTGGGKAVLLKPTHKFDREAYFAAFGRAVNSLGGRYMTAVDSGTSTTDMDIIARETRHVLSESVEHGGSGDPSEFTARGVRLGIEAAVRHVLNRSDLEGLHVVLQGVGHVGCALARELHAKGAHLTVTDTDMQAMHRCAEELGADTVDPYAAVSTPCDVFSPCALGAVINGASIPRFHTRIIAGAANNQLKSQHHGRLVHRRGIIYVPDFVINAGGLIHVLITDPEQREQRLQAMLQFLEELFIHASHGGLPPYLRANAMAQKILDAQEH